jgi:hypothetical protein
MMESSGFPVLPGHAHPFQKIAPHYFSHEEQAIFITHKAGDDYFLYVYIPESRENGKDKKRGGAGTPG